MRCFQKFFSKIGLSKGYYQVFKTKTAFKTGKGLFQFQVMSLGLLTSLATFSRFKRRVISGMDHVDNFIDDILMYTMTFEQHLKVLEKLFQRLRDAGLIAKLSKCSIQV